jgi:hypothetical protein
LESLPVAFHPGASAIKRTIVLAVALVVLWACSNVPRYETQTLPDGSIWTEADCPNADHLISGGSPDGMPMKGQTELAVVEAAVADSPTSEVVPRNGEVWSQACDGTVTVEAVEDFMIMTMLEDVSECPEAPVSSNGIPVVYDIVDY